MSLEQDPEEIIKKSFRLPRKIWAALEREAKLQLRSPTKQLEAIFRERYDFQNIDTSGERDSPTTQNEPESES